MWSPITSPKSSSTSSKSSSSRDDSFGSGTKRKASTSPDSPKIKIRVCRDLFESKPLNRAAEFHRTLQLVDHSSFSAQVFFLATGNSPNIKRVNVYTSSPIKKAPLMRSGSSAKREKHSPTIRTGRGRKQLPDQANKLTSYFKTSPKKLHSIKMEQEVIVISDDSDEDVVLVSGATGKSGEGSQVASNISVNLDDSDNDSDVLVSGATSKSGVGLLVASDIIVLSDDSNSSGPNVSDDTNPGRVIDVDAYQTSYSSKSPPKSTTQTRRTIKIEEDDVQLVSESVSYSTSQICSTNNEFKIVKNESQMSKISVQPEEAIETVPVDVHYAVKEEEQEDYSNPDTFVHQGIAGYLGASQDSPDKEQISIQQLCYFFKKLSTDPLKVTDRMKIKYCPLLAANDAWQLNDFDEDLLMGAMIKLREWHVALPECLHLTTNVIYLPMFILQHVMQNALHSHEPLLVNWSMTVLHKSLGLHPAYVECMQEHYLQLITTPYLSTKIVYPGCNVSILDQVLNLLSELCSQSNRRDTSCDNDSDNFLSENSADLKIEEMEKAKHANNVFATLSWTEKKHRVALLLEFIVRILEEDIVKCVMHENIPLVSKIFWPKQAPRSVGVANAKCRGIFQLVRQTLTMSVNKILLRLVAVMAESVLLSERSYETGYNSNKCLEFARSIYLAASASSGRDLVPMTIRLRPHWLQQRVVNLVAGAFQL